MPLPWCHSTRAAPALASCWTRFVGDQAGAMALLFGIAAPVVVMATGVAVDYASLSNDQARMQAVVDGAAMLGMTVAQRTAVSSPSTAKQAGQAAAQGLVTSAASTKVNSVSAEVSDALDQITVTVGSETPAKVLSFMNGGRYPFTVASTVFYKAPAVPICLLALDKNIAPGILFKGNGTFNGQGCVIWSNSTSATQSIYASGSSQVSALAICAGGQVGLQGSAKITPTAVASCAPFADPLAQWAPQSVSTICTNPSSSSSTLKPGVYCSSTVINGGDVTLNPGVYVIKDHKFNITANSNVTGSGVQFLLVGDASISITAGADLNLSGIADAQGNKVLIAEYGTVSANVASFSGNSKLFLDGAIHLPSQEVDVTGNSTITMSGPASTVIARNIVVGGSGTIQYPGTAKGLAPQAIAGLSTLRIAK